MFNEKKWDNIKQFLPKLNPLMLDDMKSPYILEQTCGFYL